MKKNIFAIYTLIIILIMAVVACKKNSFIEPEEAVNNRYQPLIVGSSYIWNVDSVFYNDFTQTKDTFKFKVKEFIESEIIDNEGGTFKRVERYYQNSDSLPWQLNRVFTVISSETNFIRNEENIPLLKLIYPLFPNLTWNYNLKNSLPALNVKCLNNNGRESILSKTYDTVATILHFADSSLISFRYREEKYASSIGLIYKKDIELEDSNPQLNPSIPIQKRANKGYEVIYSLKEYIK